MKKTLLTIFVLSSLLFSQNVTVKDFQVPESQAKSLRFDGAYNWSQQGSTVVSNNSYASLLFKTFYSSLPMAWFFDLNANGSKNFKNYNHDVTLDLSFRKYVFPEKDFFGFSRIYVKHEKSYKDIESDLTVGFGYGRYINATSLAKAVRIEDHFLKDKIIGTNLPKNVILQVAYIIERKEEYRITYGEIFETKWLEDIEQVLKEGGVLKEQNMSSLGILRMRQVLFDINERVNERYYGWDVSLGVLFPLTTYDDSPVGNPNLTLSGRYSFPLSWKTQINTGVELFTPIDSSFFEKNNGRVFVDFIYELSNRINLFTSYKYGFTKMPNTDMIYSHNLTASFLYYLENNIYLTVNAFMVKLSKQETGIGTSIGVRYNIL